MNKYLKILLIRASTTIILLSTLWFILWIIAPKHKANGRYMGNGDFELIVDIADVATYHLPIPIYIHVLRFNMQDGEKAKAETIRDLNGIWKSPCLDEDFTEISKLHQIRIKDRILGTEQILGAEQIDKVLYDTDYDSCKSHPDGYIVVHYEEYSEFYRDELYYRTDVLYKKSDNGRLNIVLQARVPRRN